MSGVLAFSGLWLAVLSGGMLLGGIAIALVALVMIPGNYFSKNRKTPKRESGHAGKKLALKIVKNVAGALMLIVGAIMILAPGPGVVFLLLGISLVDVPGKRKLQRYLISKPMVLKPINKLRARWNRPELRTS